ncbi:hypothetical protein TWF718_005788 [Orbilia javanica]|uniref:Uncharacterized protein n=1 Tax=Orbilia javanica TaxID=47235 RepID=A0AAN8N444_9PEZI
MVLQGRSSSVKSEENTVPERPAGDNISTFIDVGPDGPESPQGYTHPAYYRTGPVKIEKQLKLLTLDAVKQWQNETRIPISPLTGRPHEDKSYWPPELVDKHASISPGSEFGNPYGFSGNRDTFTEPSVSESPVSLPFPNFQLPAVKVPTAQLATAQVTTTKVATEGNMGVTAMPLVLPPKVTRKRSKRMWNFTNIDETEIRTPVPDKILYDRGIELWRSDIIRNGATMVGIQDGLTIFCRKMGESKPTAAVLNTFGAFIDKSIAQMVEVKEFFEEHHHHLSEKDNDLLRSQIASYKKILDQQDTRIRELETQLNRKLDLQEED